MLQEIKTYVRNHKGLTVGEKEQLLNCKTILGLHVTSKLLGLNLGELKV